MTDTERKIYMGKYNKAYYWAKRGKPTVSEIMEGIVLSVPPTQLNFRGNDKDEPFVCHKFGCKRHLTPQEQLFSKFCIHHQ